MGRHNNPVSSLGKYVLCGLYSVSRGGRGSGCTESIYRNYTLCICSDSEPTKFLYHPKQEIRRGRDRRQINTRCQVPLYRSVFKKSRHLRFGFKAIWSMPFRLTVRIEGGQQGPLLCANCTPSNDSGSGTVGHRSSAPTVRRQMTVDQVRCDKGPLCQLYAFR